MPMECGAHDVIRAAEQSARDIAVKAHLDGNLHLKFWWLGYPACIGLGYLLHHFLM